MKLALCHHLFMTVALLCWVTQARASGIDPETYAVGKWDLHLSGGGIARPFVGWDSSSIFPSMPHKQAKVSTPTSSSSSSSNSRSKQKVPCSLSIHSDGTFLLTPTSHTAKYGNANNRNAEISQKTTCMPIRGRWRVQPNPYCITDRFYDNLVLESYPRLEVRKSDAWYDPDEVLQMVTLRMNCRLWGRNRSGINDATGVVLKRGGRLSHGSILWIDQSSSISSSTTASSPSSGDGLIRNVAPSRQSRSGISDMFRRAQSMLGLPSVVASFSGSSSPMTTAGAAEETGSIQSRSWRRQKMEMYDDVGNEDEEIFGY
eukprot:CAMPEP_0198110758 /NCGR_PEP_ID=MMETSP1442-20131203/2765_1 /TAXON_ID= /ORGANISM="Craspedostauros australis, Strain CCMP3328" /LENGTH=315 /DNA_ID=CAMNT_0043766945 /DNA_START=95 /DNA_END=1042 /DNA_ORIENTATION=+